jgi:hypothetical protein
MVHAGTHSVGMRTNAWDIAEHKDKAVLQSVSPFYDETAHQAMNKYEEEHVQHMHGLAPVHCIPKMTKFGCTILSRVSRRPN